MIREKCQVADRWGREYDVSKWECVLESKSNVFALADLSDAFVGI